ncbi:SDR family NAD(P)-dependent oxidoreductase [Sulfitobacter mediterraneus]|uniref:SDR family oxidoreductase n=1 Tax=Sulfitobacter mediterraneus TaxID=83219 RepID=UPI001934AA2B|nr:SDR family NAD(P)-dependent oxidoreductase [Sulfitobacter mediterraneus]MBM1310976.1 SDR family NAD(P)-dependent oxidoreductase [Sulfitobacter mediterraneus]MBM1314859.1 SDR family NAD(P)-dependent oxidoreductase [Sulfitobacter mediterraneus]MBM1323219.1 SDR family NAD(P)-dependent oxidoreductase [Sulfitobacter mediterraneus]MBM1327131.1 SDR family NAD(P)-dependent oxidoreductase [Sulfitobacter mediterraneus]MBM1398478.1 SDR family NAD(P)-dependent oxidoreductase [Sulfitobacter mediterraneu
MSTLENRVIFITGPARNVGRAMARAMHAEGAHIVLAGLEPERLQALKAELGGRTIALDMDVTKDASVQAAFEAAAQEFGRIDAVVSNAGIMGTGSVEAAPPDTMERMASVNLTGTYRVAHLAMPYLMMSRGYFLSVCSTAAVAHSPLQGQYCATKAGVWALMDCMRQEVRHRGVDVGALCPSFVVPDPDEIRPVDQVMVHLWGEPNLGGKQSVSAREVAQVAVGMVKKREREAVAPRKMNYVIRWPRFIQKMLERAYKDENIEAAMTASRDLAKQGRVVSTDLGHEDDGTLHKAD